MKTPMRDFLIAFLCPTLLGKTLIIYFGMKYSEFPGRGYGIGLSVCILFTLVMMGRLLWKYRDYKDE